MSVKTRKVLFYAAIFLAMTIAAVFVYVNRVKWGRIISPFFIAVIVAYIVKPVVKKLVDKKLSTRVSIIAVYAIFSVILVLAVIFIIPEMARNAQDLINTLPEISDYYQSAANGFLGFIQRSGWSEDIKGVIFGQVGRIAGLVQATAEDALNGIVSGIGKIIAFFLDFSLALIIAYYFIKDADFFKNLAMNLIPRNYRSVFIKIGRDISQVTASFIQGQLFTALIVGVMETIGLLLLNVRYPLILGIFGGLTNVIPYFGPIIGAVPAIAIAFIDSPLKALWTLLLFSLVQQIDNSLISPKVIEQRLGLHPVTTLFAILIGQHFFGILGMLISVPLAAILKVISRRTFDMIL